MFLRLLLALACLPLFSSPGFAQKNKKNNNAQEKKENERVKQAQNHLQDAQRNLTESNKLLKTANQAGGSAEKLLKSAKEKVRDEREAAEVRLGEKSGFPKVVEQMKEARVAYEKLSNPIRDRVQSTDEWKLANEAAIEAKSQRIEILETIKDLKRRQAELDPLDRLIAKPLDLENAAIQANPEAKNAHDLVEKLRMQLDDLRKKYPQTMIDQDPAVKKAKEAQSAAERKVQDALKDIHSARLKISRDQAAVNNAKQQLSKAVAADRKDGK